MESKEQIIEIIISNKIEGLYEAIKKAFPTIPDDSTKERIIEKIIYGKIEGLSPLQPLQLLPLY